MSPRLLPAILLVGVLAGCATTVEDDESGTESAAPAATVSVDATTLTGSAADLLPVISDELDGLSNLIGGEGDEDAALERVEQAWAAISDEIETTRPELFRGLEAVIELTRTAVIANRPADGDKAFSILVDLIDAFESGNTGA